MQDAAQKLQLPHLIANIVCRSLHAELKIKLRPIQEYMQSD